MVLKSTDYGRLRVLDRPSGQPRLILASGSPRRKELLAQLGVPFDVVVSQVQEDESPRLGERAEDFASRLALTKAEAVAAENKSALVLAADTIVVVDGQVLGKPTDSQQAVAYLKLLRGRPHRVITAVALHDPRSQAPTTAYVETTVHFRDFTDEEIEGYVATGDPLDKAGAYAIQGSFFRPASRVDGCLHNVVGLPVCLVALLLRGAGLTVDPVRFQAPEPCERRMGGCLPH